MTTLFSYSSIIHIPNCLPAFYDSPPNERTWSVRFVHRNGTWFMEKSADSRSRVVNEELSATLFEAVKNKEKVVEVEL